MNRILLVLSFVFLVFSARSQNLKPELKALFKKYDTVMVVNGILNLDDFNTSFGILKKDRYVYDEPLNCVRFLKEDRIKYVLKKISVQIDKLNKVQWMKFIRQIREWCIIYNILVYPFEDNEQLIFDEVIYKIDSSNHLFEKYLKNSNQSWESLSSNQSNSVYYDLMNYLLSLNEKDKANYFSKYFHECSIILK